MSNALYEAKVEDERWKIYVEVVVGKFIFHSMTMADMLEGTVFKSKFLQKPTSIIDLGSLFVFSRVLIENYLMYYYLYVLPKSNEEGRLQFDLYHISGLANRQKYYVGNKEQMRQKQNETKRIEVIRERIKVNPFFEKLKKSHKEQCLKKSPKPMFCTWTDLIALSDLDTEIFESAWRLYSNYAHSEYLSMMQLKEYMKDYRLAQKEAFTVLKSSIWLTCSLIKNFMKFRKILEDTYNGLDNETQKLIDLYYESGKLGERSK